MKTSILNAAFVATLATAAPTLSKRASTDIDGTILNYALTLEHLEATFYAQGIANFTADDFHKAGFNGPSFYKNLKEIARDEATHVSFLTTALKAAGITPVAACTYDFGNLTAKSFMQTASILEGVGVSAYLGAAHNITNKSYLTAAASILTVEARHNAYVRNALQEAPAPQPFDAPLDLDQVYSLAAPFIVSCPASNPKLPVKAFPALTIAANTQTPVAQGTKVEFDVASGTKLPSSGLFVAFPLVDMTIFSSAVIKNGKVYAKIPIGGDGPAGQTYAILTTSNSTVTDENTVAGPAIVPVLASYLA